MEEQNLASVWRVNRTPATGNSAHAPGQENRPAQLWEKDLGPHLEALDYSIKELRDRRVFEQVSACMYRPKQLLAANAAFASQALEAVEASINKFEDPGLKAALQEAVIAYKDGVKVVKPKSKAPAREVAKKDPTLARVQTLANDQCRAGMEECPQLAATFADEKAEWKTVKVVNAQELDAVRSKVKATVIQRMHAVPNIEQMVEDVLSRPDLWKNKWAYMHKKKSGVLLNSTQPTMKRSKTESGDFEDNAPGTVGSKQSSETEMPSPAKKFLSDTHPANVSLPAGSVTMDASVAEGDALAAKGQQDKENAPPREDPAPSVWDNVECKHQVVAAWGGTDTLEAQPPTRLSPNCPVLIAVSTDEPPCFDKAVVIGAGTVVAKEAVVVTPETVVSIKLELWQTESVIRTGAQVDMTAPYKVLGQANADGLTWRQLAMTDKTKLLKWPATSLLLGSPDGMLTADDYLVIARKKAAVAEPAQAAGKGGKGRAKGRVVGGGNK